MSEQTRDQLLDRLRSIAQAAVAAQTASEAMTWNKASELEDLVADIEGDLMAVNEYLAGLREKSLSEQPEKYLRDREAP